MTITAGPERYGHGHPTSQFTFASTEPGATSSASSPGRARPRVHRVHKSRAAYADLADGPYTFSVRPPTPSSQPARTTRSFIVNTAPPNTTITGGPSDPSNSTSAAFTYNSTETGSTFQCSLDGNAFGTCPASYTGLSQGAHTFPVRATDAAGTTDATPAFAPGRSTPCPPRRRS